jgi:hypothetical protein
MYIVQDLIIGFIEVIALVILPIMVLMGVTCWCLLGIYKFYKVVKELVSGKKVKYVRYS